MDRTSPSPGKKTRRGKTTTGTPGIDMLAGVEGFEEIAPASGASNTIVNESSSGTTHPDAGKEVNEPSAGSSNPDAI